MAGVARTAAVTRQLERRLRVMLASHRVPGAAIAVVDGTRDHLILHGVKAAGRPERIGPDTAFDVGSCAKAYVAAAVGVLVDRGSIGFDQPIAKYVPECDFGDSCMNGQVTLRDLLSNRVGLARVRPIEAFPNPQIGALEILSRVRHLPRARPFRSGYVYNNIGFIACAIAVERLSGLPYDRFLQQELFTPLGMTCSASGMSARERLADRATSHVMGRAGPSPLPERLFDNTQGAGSLYSSGADALRWLRLHLGGRGRAAGPLNAQTLAQLHRAHTVMQPFEADLMHRPPEARLAAYAMGWALSQFHGERIVQHSGGMFGWFAHMSLIPDRGIGVAVLLNARVEIHHAISYMVLETLLRERVRDWTAIARERERQSTVAIRRLVARMFPPEQAGTLSLARYCGVYRHPAAGEIAITRGDGALLLEQRDGRLWDLRLRPVGGHVFKADFTDPAIREYVPTGFRVAFAVEQKRAVAFREPAVRYERRS